MKKLLALVLAAVMVFGMMSITAAADDKITVNLWAFTDEVPGMMTKFLEAHPELADKYEINTTIIATTDGAYQPADFPFCKCKRYPHEPSGVLEDPEILPSQGRD